MICHWYKKITLFSLLFLFLTASGIQAQNHSSAMALQPWKVVKEQLKSKQGKTLVLIRLPQKRNAILNGIEIIQNLSGDKYLAYVENVATITDEITNANIISLEAKLSESLQDVWNQNTGAFKVALHFHLAANEKALLYEQIKKSGCGIINEDLIRQNIIEISGTKNQLQSLLQWHAILSATVAAENIPLTHEAIGNDGAFIVQNIYANKLLQGDSVVIGVGDNYTSADHVDLMDRTINFNPAWKNGHGIMTAGITAGAGNINPRARGHAPHAQLISHWFNRVWAETEDLYSNFNMTLTNNSYAAVAGSCSYAGIYDLYSQALDQLALDYPDVVHVFAAGNDGGLNCSPLPNGYGNVSGGYQPAKNVLACGMSMKWLALHNSSSKGPVKDGRLKPEIVAIGGQVFCPSVNNSYGQTSGTSLSAPGVTGGLALLTQRYKHLHAGINPKSDILKSILLVSATDHGREGPDYAYGYGIMNLNRALRVLDQNQFWRDSVAIATSKTFSITVPANTAQLKVMMYYNDLPGSPLMTTQLVNDLNLSVTTPANNTYLPLILNAAPANVLNIAVQGIDNKNNSEEVVIPNPAAGTYVVQVQGANVANAFQAFTVAYDLVETGIRFLYPVTQAANPNNDSMRVYWETVANSTPYTIEFSDNNGGSWSTLASNYAPNQKSFAWLPSNTINSGACLIRLSRASEIITSSAFAINTIPVATLDANQCPGYIKMNWTAVPNATGYEVWAKRGNEMSFQASVNGAINTYTLGGLSNDSTYWVAVYPMFGTTRGYRSLGISRTPNNGTCAGTFANGDLAMRGWISPLNGRANTSTALSAAHIVSVNVANNSNVAVSNYAINYSINNGTWTTLNPATTLAAATTTTVSMSGFNFSAVGDYAIKMVVQNLAAMDPFANNDTLNYTVRQLPNPLIDLTGMPVYRDSFDNNNKIELRRDTIGWDATTRWDFTNANDTGRLRSFVATDNLIRGSRSISLDGYLNSNGTKNFMTGTFNLSNLNNPNLEARLSFKYRVHGKPKTADSNTVWVRGTDLSSWIPVYRYDTMHVDGSIINSGSISLSSALSSASQLFSGSTQIRFGQNDTSVISGKDLGNGITIDDVELYLVQNDLALLNLVSPLRKLCGAGNAVPLTVRIFNSVNQSITGATVTYQLNNNAPVTETLPSMAAHDTIDYTFTSLLNLAAAGSHNLKVYLNVALDNYNQNDSLLNISIRNQPVIANYPYLENFETSDGYFYAEGKNSSWQYGTPTSTLVKKAASGTKVWKTGLVTGYNDLENSYLYSPCFDLTGLTAPMLSFSQAIQIEDCGASICDQAFVEYTTNGITWMKLGANGQGTNWYNSALFQIWNVQSNPRWRVASIPLPVTNGTLQFRFAMQSDPGASFEGMTIDDVHVYNLDKGIYNGAAIGPLTATTSNTNFINAEQNNKLLAQYKASGANYTLSLTQYTHTALINPSNTQYFFPRSYVLQSGTPLTDSIDVRLFITDSDFLTLFNATGCSSCSKPSDAYELGITKYSGAANTENNLLTDNTAAGTQYIPYSKIKWVPYDNGYYAQVRLGSLSELWFNDGGPNNTAPLPLSYIEFNAVLISDKNVQLNWRTKIDTDVHHYTIQRSYDAQAFEDVSSVNSKRITDAQYTFMDHPDEKMEVIYYRIFWTMDNGKVFYSETRRVQRAKGKDLFMVYPNPVDNNQVHIQWSSAVGTKMNYTITDVVGKKVAGGEASANNWANHLYINTNGWAKGVYYLSITTPQAHEVIEVLLK